MARPLLDAVPWLRRSVWRLLRVVARDLGAEGARGLGHLVGDVLWFLDARGRRIAVANRTALVPVQEARSRAARASYRACAAGLALTLRLDRTVPARLERLDVVDPWGVLPLAGPAVLASLHADWDAVLAALPGRLGDLAVIALPGGDPWAAAEIARLRRCAGAATLPWQDAARGALRHLRAGGTLGILADRDYTGAGLPVRIGDAVWILPRGPAELAARTGVPLIPLGGLRSGGRLMVVVGRPIRVGADNVEAAIRELARFQVRVLSAAPARWIAFHPVVAQTTISAGDQR